MGGIVTAVSRSTTHTFSKPNQDSIRLLPRRGVEGDAHMGEMVKHRSRVARDPTQPYLRQVHLIHAELHKAGVMGIVVTGGEVRPGDPIRVELPPEPHRALEPV